MQAIKCKLGAHQYDVLKEEEILDSQNNKIGTVIVSRCKHCGKIKATRIITKLDTYTVNCSR